MRRADIVLWRLFQLTNVEIVFMTTVLRKDTNMMVEVYRGKAARVLAGSDGGCPE